MKKVIISCFVILNILTIVYFNRPSFIDKVSNNFVDKYFSQTAAYNARYALWFISSKLTLYGYLAGINNHWIMFGSQSRFNWWYKIKAKYTNGEIVLLPLARQSERTFWQKNFFDFKEAKILHNLYSNSLWREKYANYLCRQYSSNNGSSVKSIEWEVYWQKLYDPKEARRLGTHLSPEISSSLLNSFNCKKE